MTHRYRIAPRIAWTVIGLLLTSGSLWAQSRQEGIGRQGGEVARGGRKG